MTEQRARELLERKAFEKWAADMWQNSNPPDAAWIGWQGRASLSTPFAQSAKSPSDSVSEAPWATMELLEEIQAAQDYLSWIPEDLWTVFLKDADAIMALPPVKQSDGLAERVREACAKVADEYVNEKNAHPEYNMAAWDIASAIRSLDITRMDSDG